MCVCVCVCVCVCEASIHYAGIILSIIGTSGNLRIIRE